MATNNNTTNPNHGQAEDPAAHPVTFDTTRLDVLAEAASQQPYLPVPEPPARGLLLLAQAAEMILGEGADNNNNNNTAEAGKNNTKDDSAEETIEVRPTKKARVSSSISGAPSATIELGEKKKMCTTCEKLGKARCQVVKRKLYHGACMRCVSFSGMEKCSLYEGPVEEEEEVEEEIVVKGGSLQGSRGLGNMKRRRN
ncbi:hypothetical protein C8A00DRAFT_35819 [Chaetomidium leptoderma]|uniref:Uncharacterized protein n=1 Tax=Chaetomidium leptoderma TaxID=669021 RepID=A0AAN6ZUL9_9PEZI|nr:hypothetical protein C8A00DRAFT_35819 [Chaetomidium leptoderma]